jgi:tetratricopeptide (TPR) repeat protein
MLNLASSDEERERAYLGRARVYWDWEKHPQAIAEYERLAKEYPHNPRFSEDLAGLYVEAGVTDPSAPLKGYRLYAALAQAECTPSNFSTYVASGLAEAAAKAGASTVELERARLGAVRATVEAADDPFAFYALACVEKGLGHDEAAKAALRDAIMKEKARAVNPYIFDYKGCATDFCQKPERACIRGGMA